MFHRLRISTVTFGLLAFTVAHTCLAQDWPQWRGPNRAAQVTGFKAPASWPEKLTQKWQVEVGDGVSTPALAGDKLYVYAREGGDEVLRCLNAASGKELWKDEESKGKVPRFATSSSPIVVDGLCVAQLGGGIVAYNLATGKEAWKWTGSAAAYGSPVLTSVGGTKAVVAPTNDSMVALDSAKGSLLWKIEYSQGRYNAATPIVNGDTLIFAGPSSGMTAIKLAAQDGKLKAKELWKNDDNTVQFNTPVLKGDLLIGLSNSNNLFCINTKNGKTVWSVPVVESTSSNSSSSTAESQRGSARGRGRSRGGRGRGGRGGRGGYGSIVDAGSVIFAMTPAGQLAVFAWDAEKPKRIASYKVGDGKTYAYPVISGNRIFIKDGTSVALWSLK